MEDELKICAKCKVAKSSGEFYSCRYTSANGVIKSAPTQPCKVCKRIINRKNARLNSERTRAYSKIYFQEHQKAPRKKKIAQLRVWLNTLKAHPCKDCGKCFPPECMDFDHVRGVKYNQVSDMVGKCQSTKIISEELTKCELVCANCHRVRTISRGHYRQIKEILALRARVDAIKSKPCMDCGETFDPFVMEFDHVQPKTMCISTMVVWRYPFDEIEREIAKCELVCANCNRTRSFNRRKHTVGK